MSKEQNWFEIEIVCNNVVFFNQFIMSLLNKKYRFLSRKKYLSQTPNILNFWMVVCFCAASYFLHRYIYFLFNIIFSAFKQLVASKINVFIYILYVCILCIFIMCIYNYTHTVYIWNIFTFIYVYLYNLYIWYINVKYLLYACMVVYLYIHN